MIRSSTLPTGLVDPSETQWSVEFDRQVSFVFTTDCIQHCLVPPQGKVFCHWLELTNIHCTVVPPMTIYGQLLSVYVQKFQRLINGALSSGEFSKSLAKMMEDVGAHSSISFIDQWVYYRYPTFQVVASYHFVYGSRCTRTVRSHHVQEECGFLLHVFVRPPPPWAAWNRYHSKAVE